MEIAYLDYDIDQELNLETFDVTKVKCCPGIRLSSMSTPRMDEN